MLDPTLEDMMAEIEAQPCKGELWNESALIAIYWFASQRYCGEHSNLYQAMCRTGYEPSICHDEDNWHLDDPEAWEYYKVLRDRFGVWSKH